jgi:hypothetical protein
MAKITPFPTFLFQENRSNEKDVRHSYGIIDPWGRAIGALVRTWESEFVVREDVGEYEFETYYTLERAQQQVADRTARGKFSLFMQQTRGGSCYGASQSNSQFHTAEERDAAIAAYLKKARKTAEKSVVKQADKKARRAAMAG